MVYIQYISNVKTWILKWFAAILFLNERMHDIYVNRDAFVLFVRPISDNFFDSYLLLSVVKPDYFGRLINARSELLCHHSWQLHSVTPYPRMIYCTKSRALGTILRLERCCCRKRILID